MKSYKLASLVGSAMVAWGIGSGAWAGFNTGSLSVTSSVAKTCSVSTTSALAFGAYDPTAASPLPGTGSVYTPRGVTWSAAAAKAFTVCGSVPAAQDVSVDGSYTDTVIVTVNF